uniref:Myb-like domain-containing protein n=1 Tax=Erythrolobus madagascarensis TaxID=708628 RepID=A0A7S0T522_9RHOD|mmetsp:Transcript_1262/g.2553  ORF Transcript_1262/g.2553 Transcript_1262/m.2553 type:complete len:171 (+) Transcript_1262:162-674(+)
MKMDCQSEHAKDNCRPSQLFRVSVYNLLNHELPQGPISKSSRLQRSKRSEQKKRCRLFTPKEDQLLRERVQMHGAFDWVQHAKFFENRTPGQLRARWAHNLRFDSFLVPFSPEEDRKILQLHIQLGNRWAQIAGQLENRSDNAVKNRFHCLRRMLKEQAHSKQTYQIATK